MFCFQLQKEKWWIFMLPKGLKSWETNFQRKRGVAVVLTQKQMGFAKKKKTYFEARSINQKFNITRLAMDKTCCVHNLQLTTDSLLDDLGVYSGLKPLASNRDKECAKLVCLLLSTLPGHSLIFGYFHTCSCFRKVFNF